MKGRGLRLSVKLPASGTYVRVMKIKSYSPGEESVATSEKTYLDQEGLYIGHNTGMIDAGEIGFSVEYDKADPGQVLLEGNLAKPLDFKLEWKDGSGETYSGSLTKRGFGEANDDDILRNYSIKRSGAAPVPFSAP